MQKHGNRSIDPAGSYFRRDASVRAPGNQADAMKRRHGDGNMEDEILSADKYVSTYGQELQRRKVYVQKLETIRAFLQSRIAYASDPWIQKQLDETERLLREGYDSIKSLMSNKRSFKVH
jgi:hypothetical protein